MHKMQFSNCFEQLCIHTIQLSCSTQTIHFCSFVLTISFSNFAFMRSFSDKLKYIVYLYIIVCIRLFCFNSNAIWSYATYWLNIALSKIHKRKVFLNCFKTLPIKLGNSLFPSVHFSFFSRNFPILNPIRLTLTLYVFSVIWSYFLIIWWMLRWFAIFLHWRNCTVVSILNFYSVK